jgi:hypothetical protein
MRKDAGLRGALVEPAIVRPTDAQNLGEDRDDGRQRCDAGRCILLDET